MTAKPKMSAVLATVAMASTLTVSSPAVAHERGIHDNCTKFNNRYPHGVGTVGARDRVRGSTDPVTSFKRSNRIYWAAERHNPDLDRDNDRIACEQH